MASLTILFLFLAEALALILALGPSKFFRSPFYVLDIFVVSASIAFDFSDTVHREVGQCWRGGGGGSGRKSHLLVLSSCGPAHREREGGPTHSAAALAVRACRARRVHGEPHGGARA